MKKLIVGLTVLLASVSSFADSECSYTFDVGGNAKTIAVRLPAPNTDGNGAFTRDDENGILVYAWNVAYTSHPSPGTILFAVYKNDELLADAQVAKGAPVILSTGGNDKLVCE